MQTPSIRRRVVRSGLVVMTLVVLVVSVFIVAVLSLILDDSVETVLEDRVSFALELADVQGGEELLATMNRLGIPATLITPEGEEIRGPDSDLALAGGLPVPDGSADSDLIERELQVRDGTLRIGVRTAGVRATVRRAALTASAAVLIVPLLSGLAWRRVGERATRPLQQVSEIAAEIAGGDTTLRIDPDDPSTDIGQMAHALDEALEALSGEMDRARSAEQSMSLFVLDAAHQLRTPLQRIRTTGDTLRYARSDRERSELEAQLGHQLHAAAAMIDDLLVMARLDTAHQVHEVFDIVGLVGEVVGRARARAAGIAIVTSGGSDGELLVCGSRTGVAEAVGNVVDNSLRHATDRITVTVTATPTGCTITILDDGPGVPTDRAERIFDRFVSLDGHGGSGLGLAIARRLTELSGGTLVYDRGFRFSFHSVSTDGTLSGGGSGDG